MEYSVVVTGDTYRILVVDLQNRTLAAGRKRRAGEHFPLVRLPRKVDVGSAYGPSYWASVYRCLSCEAEDTRRNLLETRCPHGARLQHAARILRDEVRRRAVIRRQRARSASA